MRRDVNLMDFEFDVHATPTRMGRRVPILRWLSRSTPSSSPSTPPSACLSSLNEALHEPLLPIFPPQARLPNSRNPPFYDNPTRSTLPTSSLSPPLRLSRTPSPTLLTSPPAVLTHSPPNRTSLDTLRSLSNRDHSRSASSSSSIFPALPALPALPIVSDSSASQLASWWWSASDNKENINTLLNEDDRADSPHQQQDNIRKKCSFSSSFSILSALIHLQTVQPRTLSFSAMVFLVSIPSPSVPP